MSHLTVVAPELQKIAAEQLNEVESRIEQDIAAMREWIKMQPHLNSRTDDRFILAFLRGAKYSLEKAKSKLDRFYTIRPILPQLFEKNISMDETNIGICRSNTYIPLPQPWCIDGPRIHLSILKNIDLEKYTFNDLIRYDRMLLETKVFDDDNYTICGYIELIDGTNTGVQFLSHFDFSLLKKLSLFAIKASPMRLKGIYMVNFPTEAHTLMTFGRSLLPKKLQTRLHVYKTFEDLYKDLPQKYLPIEYGGNNGKITETQAELEEFLMQYDFDNINKYGVNEKFSQIKQINYNEIYGIEGSFRKLNID